MWSIGCILFEYYEGFTLYQVTSVFILHAFREDFDLVFTCVSLFTYRLMTIRSILLWWRYYRDQSPREWSRGAGDARLCTVGLTQTHVKTHSAWHMLVFPHRKQKYFHRGRLDWNECSKAGRYVKAKCKPLRVSWGAKFHHEWHVDSLKQHVSLFICVLCRSTCCHRGRSTTSFFTSWRTCWSTSPRNASLCPLLCVTRFSSTIPGGVKCGGTAVIWADDPDAQMTQWGSYQCVCMF